MTRILHVASLAATLELFCAPMESRAVEAGFEFIYLHEQSFEESSILQRGYRAVESWRYSSRLRDRINTIDPDIVQVHTPSSALALLPILRSVRRSSIYVARGGLGEGRSVPERWAYRRIDPMFWSVWDHVAVLNTTQLEKVRGSRSAPSTRISTGGIPLAPPPSVDRRDDQGRLRLLWVGRLTRDKQPLEALAVAEHLRREGYIVDITFVGAALPGDKGSDALQDAIRKSDVARAVGWVSDVSPFYRSADVLLVTSRREGYGLTPVEAARYGVPTVGFETEGTRQSITDAAGVLVPQGDRSAMVAEVRRLLDSSVAERADRRHAAVEAARRLSSSDVWMEWNAIYASLA